MTDTFLQPTLEADFQFAQDEPFRLSKGGSLSPVNLRYTLYGKLNGQRDNAILVCHALSGSAAVADWWPEMFGPDRAFDPAKHCIIGVNIVGSCYGSTGPASINPATGSPYGYEFPLITISDIVRAQSKLIDYLGIGQLRGVAGGSIGGMQALQWAVDFPDRVERCIAIGAAPLSAMGLALNHIQRQAVMNDPAWADGRYYGSSPPAEGLSMARAIAMCSYKSAELFNARFGRRPNRNGEDPYKSFENRFDVAGYLDYQGAGFVKRFDANSYLVLTKAMDTFDLGADYRTEAEAFRRIRAKMLLIGISSDWLFPASDVEDMATRMRDAGVDANYIELESSHGHDGFLADAGVLAPLVGSALDEQETMAVA
jgi:homoserine O-acetyltransferase/O-succinyltransferase